MDTLYIRHNNTKSITSHCTHQDSSIYIYFPRCPKGNYPVNFRFYCYPLLVFVLYTILFAFICSFWSSVYIYFNISCLEALLIFIITSFHSLIQIFCSFIFIHIVSLHIFPLQLVKSTMGQEMVKDERCGTETRRNV